MELNTPVTEIKGIGESKAKLFAKLGVVTVADLLSFYPRSYEYRGEVKKIFEIYDGETASVVVKIDAPPKEAYGKSGISYVKTVASDNTGYVQLTFFNMKWITRSLVKGRVFRVYGKFVFGLHSLECVNPIIEPYASEMVSVYPIYQLTEGLTNQSVARAVKSVIGVAEKLKDILPEDIRKQFLLLSKSEATVKTHFPQSKEEAEKAARTLAFEELTVFQLSLRKLRSTQTRKKSVPLSQKDSGMRLFFESLPFSLTNAQQRTVKEIFADLHRSTPMMRLVQGDVGSGKTVIAASAVYLCAKNGYQSAVMAPTEILATQHYNTFEKLLSPFGINVLLLIGSMTKAQKTNAQRDISNGTAQVIIGTNAMIQSSVEFKNLCLAVTDEQHRFGVVQRASLIEKGNNEITPHTLVMSATPIPRTLSLILYGDLDISIIDELPPGRQKIETVSVESSAINKVYGFIKREIQKGRQAFIVCPLVEESEKTDAVSALEKYEEIKRYLPEIPCGLLHGKMKNKEKDEVMDRFRAGKTKILVSTTVIEVGVDVPNATVMAVQNAERFGLSTLHQLRGRIGRGKERSYCILIYDSQSKKSKERLETMCNTDDGFEIARADLKLRGPGDFFGERQSGEIKFKVAGIADMPLVEQTRSVVDTIIDKELLKIPEYKHLDEISDRMRKMKENTIN